MAKKRRIVLNLISLGGDSTPYKVYNPILGSAPNAPLGVAVDVPEEFFDGKEITLDGLIWIGEQMNRVCAKAWKKSKGE